MYTVRVLRSATELETVRTFWEENVSHPNAQLDFYSIVAESRIDIVRPHVLAVSAGDQVVALLVGRLEEKNRPLRFGYFNLHSGRSRTLVIIYGGCLGLWNCEIAALATKELFSSLQRKEADLVIFHSLVAGSPLLKAVRQGLSVLRPRLFSSPNRHWKMNVPASLEDFLKGLNSKHRYNIRRERRLFEKKFGRNSKFLCFTREDSVNALTEDIEHVASGSYHRRFGFGFVKNDETLKRMRLEARQGRLRTYVLYIEGISVAFWQGTTINGTLYLGSTAYDSRLKDYTPGKLVLQYMLEDLSMNSDIRTVDFGFGDASYKKQYGDFSWEEISVTVYAPSLRGFFIAGLEIGSAQAREYALRILNLVGGVESVKKYWRNLAGARKRSGTVSQ